MNSQQREALLAVAHDGLRVINLHEGLMVTDVVMIVSAMHGETGKMVIASVTTLDEEPWKRIGMLKADEMFAASLMAGMMFHKEHGKEEERP